jgi:hypothetical protein
MSHFSQEFSSLDRSLVQAALIALMFASGAAIPAVAATKATSTATVPTQSDKDDVGKADRVICRTIEETGTRLGAHKTCATAAEWSARRSQERDAVDRIQRTSTKSY